MPQNLGFVFVAVVSVLCVTHVDAQQKPYEDMWTKEQQESSQNCRGRLPNPLSGPDVQFLRTLASGGVYVKYADQPFLFRVLGAVLAKQGSENKPLSEIRCLFESPCMVMRDFAQENATVEVCTGGKVNLETRDLDPEGTMEGPVLKGSGKVDKSTLTITGVPTFTDRKSFVTIIACLGDGSLSFVVLTNRAGLSPYTRHLIKEHLNNSGFKDNFRISTAFMSSSCKNRV